jgi:Uma2 family endonuclease
MFNRSNAVTMTVDEYLKMEESVSVRHEFIDGYVFAMTGAAEAHNVICVNLVYAAVPVVPSSPT